MSHIKIAIESVNVDEEPQILICAYAPGHDKTLCGHETTRDRTSGVVATEDTTARITCHVCASIIRHCHKIKLTEISDKTH